MPESKKEKIQNSLITRLQKITNANGYDTNVLNVFGDEIPMGLDLDEFQLPAILVLNGRDILKHQQGWLLGTWTMELQLIHLPSQTDNTMKRFVRDVNKVIFADDPLSKRRDAWRSFGGSPTEWRNILIEPDVNMIEANRFHIMVYEVSYHTDVTDL